MVSLFVMIPFRYVEANGDLSGTVFVTHTAETASDAKDISIDDARRQILYNVLSKYSEPASLKNLLQNTPSSDLSNFITSSSIANEQSSKTVYSANVTMNIDNNAIKQWLNDNDVQNWIPLATESVEKTNVSMSATNGVDDWIEIKQLSRENNVDIDTKTIIGNQITFAIPVSNRSKFTAAVKNLNWGYSDNNGSLKIWK